MSKKVLIVSAHPDDEILGAGGALIKHRNVGDDLAWLIITNMKESDGFSQDHVLRRQNEIQEIAERLKMKVYFLEYPTMKLSGKDIFEMVSRISEIFLEFKPERIYVVNRSDAHTDHRITFDAVIACTKSFRYPYIKEILMYECISETEFAPQIYGNIFMPNYFVDISEIIDQKLELMKVYESELGPHPFPRSLDNIKALAHFRGAVAGVRYAEAFQLVKYIDK